MAIRTTQAASARSESGTNASSTGAAAVGCAVGAADAEGVGADIASPNYRLVDAALVQRAHAAGLAVVPWTVNDAGDMVALIDLGVDGLITDYPTLLRQVMAERGMPLPPAYQPV